MYPVVNGIVNIAGAPGGYRELPEGASKAAKCVSNGGAVGDLFLLEGCQKLTDGERERLFRAQEIVLVLAGSPMQRNHTQSHLHKSGTRTLAQQKWPC